MKIGCHVSMAGGMENAPQRALDLGCETFQIFSRSPRGGKAIPITPELAKKFKDEMKRCDIKDFVIHTPYYINFGSEKNNIYYGSASVVRGELERGSLLGARYVMTHLGSFGVAAEKDAMQRVIDGLKKVLEGYNGSTLLLLEISAGSGTIIGSNFKQLGKFVKVLKKYKGFGGICFDTQHAFASGYDVSSASAIKKTFLEFDKEIGLQYLQMSHINDSKFPLGSKRDRHDHIGEGHIGRAGFGHFLKFWAAHEKKTKREMPLILETEHDKVIADIKALKELRKNV